MLMCIHRLLPTSRDTSILLFKTEICNIRTWHCQEWHYSEA